MELSNEYVQGFNNGYIIRKNHPLLMKSLINGTSGSSQYLQGLRAGGQQYEKEVNVKIRNLKQEQSINKKKKDKGLGM